MSGTPSVKSARQAERARKAAASALHATPASAPASSAAAAAVSVAGPSPSKLTLLKRKRDIMNHCETHELVAWAKSVAGSDTFTASGVDVGNRIAVVNWIIKLGKYPPTVDEAKAASTSTEEGADTVEQARPKTKRCLGPQLAALSDYDTPTATSAVAQELGVTTSAPEHDRECLHCFTPVPSSIKGPCPYCKLFPFLSVESIPNRLILNQAGLLAPGADASSASAAAAASSGQSDTHTSVTPKLSAADRELERLAAEGADWPRFQDADVIRYEAAFKQGRSTYRGSSMAVLSKSLVKLIRSGRFTQLSLALPRDAAAAAAADTAASSGHDVRVDTDGKLLTRAALQSRPLVNLNELMKVFFCGILPSLFDRPRALLDWAGLMRSAVVLDETYGWPVANEYVVAALLDRVPQREPFHDYQPRLLEERRAMSLSMRGPIPAPAQQHATMIRGMPDASPSAGRLPLLHGACRDWNFSACPEPCRNNLRHHCNLPQCTTPGLHRAADCPQRIRVAASGHNHGPPDPNRHGSGGRGPRFGSGRGGSRPSNDTRSGGGAGRGGPGAAASGSSGAM